MKACVIQERFKGPWRWCIVDQNKTIAASPVSFRKHGQAMNSFKRFIKQAQALQMVTCPSVQMEIEWEPPK